jgi:hypothetical protein
LLEENIIILAEQRLEELKNLLVSGDGYTEDIQQDLNTLFIRLSQLTEFAMIPNFGLSGAAIIKLQAIDKEISSITKH